MSTKIIAHGVDVDGIASHAIIGREVPAEHVFTDYPTFVEDLNNLSKSAMSNIIIADISPSGDKQILKNAFLKNSHHNFKIWLDHHDWKGCKFLLNHFENYVIDTGRSTSQIAADYFGVNGVDRLAKLGRIHDMKESNHSDYGLALNIQKAISFSDISEGRQDNLEYIVDSLRKGSFNSKKISLMAKSYDKISDKARRDLADSYFIKDISGSSFGFGFPAQVLYMKEGLRVLREEVGGKVDYLVAIYPNGAVIIDTETKNPKIDIVEACKTCGGGGRDGGGGFMLRKEDVLDKELLIDGLLGRIAEYKINL